jgi:hypothetical protein
LIPFVFFNRRLQMMRNVSPFAALAAVAALAAISCKSDKSTGPTTSTYAGTYSGIIAGATTSGVLTITIPSTAAAAPARGSIPLAYDVDAVVTLAGSLKIAGGSTYVLSGSFDDATGQLSGVTAGPYAIAGGFVGGKFTGTWTNTSAGTSGGFSLLSVPVGGSALALCGVFTGSDNGVWNLSIVGSSMAGEAANSSGALRLTGTFNASTGAMTGISSPDDATLAASGSLTTPANTASGSWSADGGTGTWSGSVAACN